MLLDNCLNKRKYCTDVDTASTSVLLGDLGLDRAVADASCESLRIRSKDTCHPLNLVQSIVQISHIASMESNVLNLLSLLPVVYSLSLFKSTIAKLNAIFAIYKEVVKAVPAHKHCQSNSVSGYHPAVYWDNGPYSSD